MDKIFVEYTSEPMETAGMYIPQLNLIILDGTRCEDVQRKCLLHELAHAKYHSDAHLEYKNVAVHRIKMEHEANQHMANELVDYTLSNTNVDVKSLNWLDLANSFDIDPILIEDALKSRI